MTIAVAQMKIAPGEPGRNLQTMLERIREARERRAEIILFPELAISGLLFGDLAGNEAFVAECMAAGEQLAESAQDIMVIYGNLDYQSGGLENAVYLAYNGENGRLNAPLGAGYIDGAYDIFNEAREFQTYNLALDGKIYRFGFILGDWRGDALPFSVNDIDMLVNLSQKPLALCDDRPEAMIAGRQYISVNTCGLANRNKLWHQLPGGSCFFDFDGSLIARGEFFSEGLYIWQRQGGEICAPPPPPQFLADALVTGTRDFMAQIKCRDAVIGISGGIDSALAACVYTRALGAENVHLISMPGKFNSNTTQELAAGMASALDVAFAKIPVDKGVDGLIGHLGRNPFYYGGEQRAIMLDDLARENIYARDRARILAAAAASLGGIFTCNGNKAECAVGYATFYGDLAGAFAAQADLWKYQVYQACRYFEEIFPQAPLADIAALRPSAELSPQQDVDKGLGDPLIYEYHDYLLRCWTEQNKDISAVLRAYQQGNLEELLGCEPGLPARLFARAEDFVADTERWWRQYRGISVAKRMQAPPLLALSGKPIGARWGEAQLEPYFSHAYLELKRELLR